MLRSPWRAMLRRSGLALIALLAVSRSVVAPGQSRAASASLPNQALAAMTNLDQDFYDPHAGGLLWADGHPDRPTVSTAPAITIAARLADLTLKSVYRVWAARLYAWENANLEAPNGLFGDHLGAGGAVDKDIVSYNQGVMIDANLAQPC